MKIILIYTTTNTKESANKISEFLINKKLCTCIHISKIQSVFEWKGKINSETEYRLTIKTKLTHKKLVEKELTDIHPYETPVILTIDNIEINKESTQWMNENLCSVSE